MADYALAQGIFEEAVSSAYYSAHHSARALLFSLGLEVRSHDGLRSLLGEHFVRDGRLPRDTTSKLGDLFVGRLEADYGTHVRFSRERAETSVIWSKEFVEAAARILAPFLTPAARPFRRLPLRGRARARGTDAACIVATRGEKTCSSAQLRAAVRRSAMAGLVKPVGG